MRSAPWWFAALAGLAVLAAGCGVPSPVGDGAAPTIPPTPSTSTPTPSTTVPNPGIAQTFGLKAGCGRVSLEWPVGDLGTMFKPFEGDIGQYISEDIREEWDWVHEKTVWFIVEESETELLLFARSVTEVDVGPLYENARFELVDGVWRAYWGDCRIQVTKDGFGIATFQLDTDNPPQPSESTVHLLATERSCASGQAPNNREILPIAIETTEVVEIIVMVELPGGTQTCQGNPSFPVVVQLDQRLGDRLIRDAAMDPVVDHPWPPPAADPYLSIFIAGDSPNAGTANVFAWSGPYAGALLLQSDGWVSERTWYQSLFGDSPLTITGFVTACDSQGGCVEECEAAACNALPRLEPECSMTYTPSPGKETQMTITFDGGICTIEAVDVDI